MSIYIKRDLKEFISRRFHKSDCVCKDCAINSLIDVVTEQQKRIDNQQKEIEQNYERFVSHEITYHLDQGEKTPYSAQRPTGEIGNSKSIMPGVTFEYCKCVEPIPCTPTEEEFNCGKCHACGLE